MNPEPSHISFYFDPISPYAYLAFERLPVVLTGLSYTVSYKPVLFAGMLAHHGQLGPAEIPAKKAWTFRQIAWLARQHAIPIQTPVQHPFNPLALLRLAVACGQDGECNRFVAESVFRHVWLGGLDAQDQDRLAQLALRLAPRHNPESAQVKAQLKANTDQAIARGVFGVPSFEVSNKVFWGLDALPMLRECMVCADAFPSEEWLAADGIAGIKRARSNPSC